MAKRKPPSSEHVMFTDEQRLSRLEVRQVQTETQQEAIFDAIKAQSHSIEALSARFSQAIDDLSNKITMGAKTDWRIVMTGAALGVTVLSALGYGIVAPVLERVQSNSAMIQQHIALEGHPPTMVKTAIALEKLRWVEWGLGKGTKP